MVPPAARVLTLAPGDNYAKVDEALRSKTWESAFVVQVDARSLELLCEDLGSGGANRAFNTITHRVLGVAEQVRYCDRRANTWFDAPRGGYDNMRNPINCERHHLVTACISTSPFVTRRC